MKHSTMTLLLTPLVLHLVASFCVGRIHLEDESLSASVRWFEERCTVVIHLRNEGKTELSISSVSASCGCMTTTIDRLKVPPGERFSIRTEVEVGDHDTDFSKTVVVVSSDPETPVLSIPINIQVERSVRLDLEEIAYVAPSLEAIKVQAFSLIAGLELQIYDLPAEHWSHLRTTNPIESTFATVRLRTYRTKGPGSREAGLTMAFKLVEQAQKRWRKLNGSKLLSDVIENVQFTDGIKKQAA